jgi:hypothetical protein
MQEPETRRFLSVQAYAAEVSRLSLGEFCAHHPFPFLYNETSRFTVELACEHDKVLTLGSGPLNDIVIDDPAVSTQHAWLTMSHGVWNVWGNAAMADTTVNGMPVLPNRPHVVAYGDHIAFGTFDLLFLGAEAMHAIVTNLVEDGVVEKIASSNRSTVRMKLLD